jgi:hypothetical protein
MPPPVITQHLQNEVFFRLIGLINFMLTVANLLVTQLVVLLELKFRLARWGMGCRWLWEWL